MKPFVYLYETPFGYYFYETNRNEIVKVNKDLYQYIKDVISDKTPSDIDVSEKTKQEYIELQEFGYLSPPRVQEIQHPLTGNLHHLLSRKVDKLTLQVTQNCNLRCSYCIYSENSNLGQRAHSLNAMSFDTAKKALDFYRKNSVDSNLIVIGFYGGEPLLEFGLIESVVDYANTIFEGREISYAITTNATLLNDRIIDFLLKNNFKILVSIDGPQKVQDKNRTFKDGTGTYGTVMKNISKLYDKDPNKLAKLMLSMVVDPCQDYNELTTLFDEPLLKNVSLTYTFIEEDAFTLSPSAEYITAYNYDMFLALAESLRSEDRNYPNKMVEQDATVFQSGNKQFKTNILSPVSAPSGPCVPGKLKLFVSYSGDLYPCERVNEDCCMKIGSLDEGFDFDAIKTILNIGSLASEKCKNCWAFSLCTVCAKRVDENGSLSAQRKMKACSEAKAIAVDKIANRVLEFEHENHMIKMFSMKGDVSK